MEKGEPPSSVSSNTPPVHPDDALQSGFQQLIQHNAATSSPYHASEVQSIDMGGHTGLSTHSRYPSPVPQQNMMPAYDHHSPMNQTPPYAAPGYPGEYQTAYPADPSPYPQLPDVGPSIISHYSTPATSPPTPVQQDGMTTRSGRAIVRATTSQTLTRPARIEKSSPKPKSSRRKTRKRGVDPDQYDDTSFLLAAPLSVLVKDLTHVVDTDIEAYVNRSPETRQQEVAESKTGKVKRPMNAFMLYRKAYQNRTKEWKKHDDIRKRAERASEGKPEKGHDNHQVISQVCGMSWNMEPQALRDQYDEWAKVERNNHKKAFPDYKFAPAKAKNKKPGTSGSNRRDERDSDDDNASILDSYEFSEFPGHPKGGPPSRTASRSQRYMDHPDGDYILPGYSPPSGYSRSVYNSPSPALQPSGLPAGTAYAAHVQQQLQHHPSSFQYSNPGKPRPADYGASLGHEQYYQQRSEYAQQAYPHPHSQMHGYGGHPYMQHSIPAFVENVFVNKANSPAASSSFHGSPVLDHHQAYSDLMGTPAYGHAQLSRPRSQIHQSIEPQIDPSLMSTPPGAGVVPHEEAYDALGLLGDFGADGLQPYSLEPGMAGGVEGGSHSASPHPQQFEQAYHTPNGNDVSTPAEGDDKSATKENSPFAVPDIADADCDLPSKLDNPSSDWETSLGGSADFGLEDIDQFLGTTQDSPVGA